MGCDLANYLMVPKRCKPVALESTDEGLKYISNKGINII
jgi:hypothetical protein